MGKLDNANVRNMIAAAVVSSGKVTCCFPDVPIEDLKFLDITTWEPCTLEDVVSGRCKDVQVSDGYDTYEMFEIIDAHVYEGKYLKIETEDNVLSNANINVEVFGQEIETNYQGYSEHDDPSQWGVKVGFDKIQVAKEDKWYKGMDSSGYLFGEQHNECDGGHDGPCR